MTKSAAYLEFMIAVAVFAGSLGYGLGVALMGLFRHNFELLSWVVGIVLAVVMVFVFVRLNLQKYIIIVGTALLGAALTMSVIDVGFFGLKIADFFGDPLQIVMSTTVGFWGWLVFIVIAVTGILAQMRSTQTVMVKAYENRM